MRSSRFVLMIAIVAAAIAVFALYGAQPALSQANVPQAPDPAAFVAGVNNPYFPLVPGTRYVYEAKFSDGSTERDEVEVLSETRPIMGVTATVVHDQVFLDGVLMEDTHDWFAQDNAGNVWYLGEAVDTYKKNGKLSNQHKGAWEWGMDGALPGVIMWADPSQHINEVYYQEYYPRVAEDQGQVLSVQESVAVPYGSFDHVVQTYDFSPLDKGGDEYKFYAQGIGLIKEVEVASGEESVLIEYTTP
jgi:hypothetical protein